MAETLVIVGASVRAAAASARRAGLVPFCADRFADSDLRQMASVVQVIDYPRGLARIVAAAPAGAWCYTGGLENYPSLVDRMARRRVLYGNPGSVLRRVRDPMLLQTVLRRAGVAYAEVAPCGRQLPGDGTWLRKPCHGAGGSGIIAWLGCRGGARRRPAPTGPVYFQRRIPGRSFSAVYVAAGGRARLLGVTRQLVGTPWTAARPFHYAGSLGPVPLAAGLDDQFRRLGEVLAGEFGLAGLFGADVVLSRGVVWLIEVNPRYTASVEVLERGLGLRAMRLHVAACRDGRLPKRVARAGRCWCGKAIVFARRDLIVPPAVWHCLPAAGTAVLQRNRHFPAAGKQCHTGGAARAAQDELADVPSPGTRICAGGPVVTVLAAAASESSMRRALRRRVRRVESLLYAQR